MSDGDFVTIAMCCEHTGRHRWTIAELFKRAGLKGETNPTRRNTLRFRRSEANRVLRLHWPEVKPIPHA